MIIRSENIEHVRAGPGRREHRRTKKTYNRRSRVIKNDTPAINGSISYKSIQHTDWFVYFQSDVLRKNLISNMTNSLLTVKVQ